MVTFAKAPTFFILLSPLQLSRQVSASEIIPQVTSQLHVPSLVSERSLEVDPIVMKGVNHYSAVDAGRSRSANRKILQSGCQAHDISIRRAQVDGDGIPQFNVQVVNTYSYKSCQIFNIVAACGAFSLGSFVNPHVFKRLDVAKGTCLVNDSKSMSSGETLVFNYFENFIQPISLLSASVSCSPK